MEILITEEKVDMTSLLEVDWMKRLKLTIGINLSENSQAERGEVFNKLRDPVDDNGTINGTETNSQLKAG